MLNLCTEVRFKDHGVKSLEVIDNGSGISKENYEGLGKQRFVFFGFRRAFNAAPLVQRSSTTLQSLLILRI